MLTFVGTKGPEIRRGKTKILFAVEEDETQTIVHNTDNLTKNDDAAATIVLVGKGGWATETTCRVFELLKAAGLPVAYGGQISNTEFLAPRCTMISLECIARRQVAEKASYKKRHPDVPSGYRFRRLETEFYLKTSGGWLQPLKGPRVELPLPLEKKSDGKMGPIDDPLIINPKKAEWNLQHPRIPLGQPDAEIKYVVKSDDVLPEGVTIDRLDELTRKVFLILERAWEILGYTMLDIKIEFGIDAKGNLFIADVIDNDSWRLLDEWGKEVSKQLHRDNAERDLIIDKYKLVASLPKHFRIPKQILVLWRNTPEDPEMTFDLPLPGVTCRTLTVPANRPAEEEASKVILDKILRDHPAGGVIVVSDLSRTLAAFLAAHTSWPVISTTLYTDRAALEEAPLLQADGEREALHAALHALCVLNPAAYMQYQYAKEENIAA